MLEKDKTINEQLDNPGDEHIIEKLVLILFYDSSYSSQKSRMMKTFIFMNNLFLLYSDYNDFAT